MGSPSAGAPDRRCCALDTVPDSMWADIVRKLPDTGEIPDLSVEEDDDDEVFDSGDSSSGINEFGDLDD